MTKDIANKIIGLLLILSGLLLFGYLIFSTQKSLLLSGVAGLLFGIGFKILRTNKKKDEKAQNKSIKSDAT